MKPVDEHTTVTLPDGTTISIADWLGCEEHRFEAIADEAAAAEILGEPLAGIVTSARQCAACGTIAYEANLGNQTVPGVRLPAFSAVAQDSLYAKSMRGEKP